MSKSFIIIKKLVFSAVLSGLGIVLMQISFAPIPASPWLKIDISDIVVYIAAVLFGPISAIIVAFIKSLADFIIKGSEVGIPINQLIAFTASLSYALPLYYVTRITKSIIKTKANYVKPIALVVSLLFLSIALSFTLSVWTNYILVTKLLVALPTNFTYWFALLILPVVVVILVVLFSIITKVFHITEEVILRVIPAMVGTISLTVLLTFLNYVWFTPMYLKLLGWNLPDHFLNYVLMTYGPFNLAKGLIISVLYFIISYRLNLLANVLLVKEEENLLNLEE